jgi:hypothetical protein
MLLSEMIRGSLSRVSSPPCCAARVQEGSGEAGDTAETAEGAEGQRARMFGSQFAVTLKKCPQRDDDGDGGGLAFGRLLRGFGVLRQLEKVDTGSREQPLGAVVISACGELEAGHDGVVVGADGDPFTPWPQDYPNMSDRGDQYLTRVAASETIKSFGNEAFNAGDFLTANRKYTKVTRPAAPGPSPPPHAPGKVQRSRFTTSLCPDACLTLTQTTPSTLSLKPFG